MIDSPSHDLAFERIFNKPRRGLGAVTLRLLHQSARAAQVSLFEAARRLVSTDELRLAARRSLGDLVANFERWRAMLEQLPPPELIKIVLDESGYTAMWMAEKSADAPGRLENLNELVNATAEFDNLAGFLEHVALVMELNEAEGQDLVNIMTLHSAKGLEFDTVFLAGWEDGLFPNQRALNEHGTRALEEERRLAYVGLTRARKQVVLSFVARRRLYGSWEPALPSRFLDELPKEHVEMENDPGLYVVPGARTGFGLGGVRSDPVLDGAVQLDENAPPGTFAEGMRVFHQLFRYGRVVAVDGDRLDIDFDKAGKKRVLARFVVPKGQAG